MEGKIYRELISQGVFTKYLYVILIFNFLDDESSLGSLCAIFFDRSEIGVSSAIVRVRVYVQVDAFASA